MSKGNDEIVGYFAWAAAAYCEEIEKCTGRECDPWELLGALSPLVADVYRMASMLPPAYTSRDPGSVGSADADKAQVRRLLTDVLGSDAAELVDDLTDLYEALRPGVAAVEAAGEGIPPAAIAAWRYGFGASWGESALAAMSAMHRLLFAPREPGHPERGRYAPEKPRASGRRGGRRDGPRPERQAADVTGPQADAASAPGA